MAFANILDGVIVHPTGFGEPYDISLYARISAIAGGVNLFPAQRSAKEMVAQKDFRVSLQTGLLEQAS
jgi:hypothetical protein